MGSGISLYVSKGLETKLAHPLGVALLLGELFDDLRGQAVLHAVGVVFLILYIIYAAVDILDLSFSLSSQITSLTRP